MWVLAFDADTGAVLTGIRTTRPELRHRHRGEVESADKLWMSTIAFPALAVNLATWANSDFSSLADPPGAVPQTIALNGLARPRPMSGTVPGARVPRSGICHRNRESSASAPWEIASSLA